MLWAEALEPRLLLHAEVQNFVLVMHQATPGALVNDTFVISYDPVTFEVVMQHQGSLGHPGARTSIALFNSIRVECGPGDDNVIVQGTGNRPITILCGDGNDSVTIQNTDNNPSTVLGEAGNDTITGGGEADSINGGDGDDQINGGGGNDTIYGDASIIDPPGGFDVIFGGAGDDTIYPGAGGDAAHGDAGNDYISDHVAGANYFYGDDGNDQIYSGPDSNYLRGGAGNDSLYADDQADTLIGDDGNDLLAGFGGDDTFFAGDNARDTVNGGDGNDLADVDALDFITADTEERTGVQAPYFGGPWFLPTTIEAENFDFGGQDVAYHDNDVNLASAGTRGRTFVDVGTALILTRPPASVTYVSANAGEWIEYTVDVPADGGYQIQTSVSSSGAPGGTFHYELDGVAKTPSLSVPNTGLLIAFRNVTWGGINLPAGRHILRLSFDTDSATTGQVGLFNAINLVYEPRQPYNGAAAPIPGTVEAEQFDTGGEGVAFHELTLANEGGQYRNTAVDIEASSDTGGGFDLGFTKAGEWVEYDVNVARTGIYVLSARVASDGLGGIFRILFGGVDRTGGVKVPNTGGWQTWQTVTRGVKLTKGEQVMRLNLEPGGATGWVGNFNWIRIAPLDGDANLDGKVNFADYQALELAYGKAVDPWAPGDFDGDGASGNNDVRLLLANYGASITPAVPADPVPEPAATARSPSAMPPEPVVLPPHPRKPVARTPRPV